jgi:hypothetical protein
LQEICGERAVLLPWTQNFGLFFLILEVNLLRYEICYINIVNKLINWFKCDCDEQQTKRSQQTRLLLVGSELVF